MPSRFHQSLTQLSELVTQKNAEFITFSTGEPLLQACQLIGQAMGLSFKPALRPPYGVEEICAASNIRCRHVHLEGNWWQESQSHLLGFDAKTLRPIALMSSGESGYERVDPVTLERTPLTAEEATHLLPTAYMFYPTLPDTISLGSAIRFTLRGCTNNYLTLAAVGLLIVLVSFFFPIANQLLFDHVIPSFQITLFVQVLIGLCLSALSAAVFMTTRSLLMVALSGTIENRVQAALWDRLLKLPLTFFRSLPTGDLIQRTMIVDSLRQNLSESVLRMILNGVFSCAYLIVMLYYSPQLTLMGLLTVVLGVLVSIIIFLMRITYERALWASGATLNAFLTQLITGIGKCRVAAAESRAFTRWAESFGHYQWLQLKTGRLASIASTAKATLSIMAPLVLFATVLWMMNVKPKEATLTIGSFLAFNAAFIPFSNALFDAANILASIVGLVPTWERTQPLFKTPPETTNEKRDPGTLTGDIQVEHVFFRYQPYGDFVLHDLSMQIEPGECVGIVGPSGCGKSSLCRLLLGFETAEKGTIYFNKQPSSWIDPQRLREQIGAVLQTSTLFSGSIYDNITCGRPQLVENIQHALQLSTFERDLADLPMGLQTLLPSGGGILSGGQKQRLLIARALIRRPKILILDEATSALDRISQAEVTHNLQTLGVTQIIIAHHLNTVHHANHIYVLEKGSLIKNK